MLIDKMREFPREEIYKKKRSGMTVWEEYLFRIGVRKASDVKKQIKRGDKKIFYDPAKARWSPNCSQVDEVEADPILVPEILWLTAMTLGGLP